MADYKEVAKVLVKHILGEERFQEIYQKYGLTSADEGLLNQVLNEWKPDLPFVDIVSMCQKYEDYPNIERVMRAWEAMAVEAARVSTSRKL